MDAPDKRAAAPAAGVAADSTAAALAADFAHAGRLRAGSRFDDAVSLCRRTLATAPGHPRVMLVLGEIFSATGRHEDAVAALAPVAERWPNAGSARFCLGNALHTAGRLPEAAAQRALGRCDGAIRSFEAALAIKSGVGQGISRLGHLPPGARRGGGARSVAPYHRQSRRRRRRARCRRPRDRQDL
jgi:Tetratricopeptide repeat